MYTLSQSSSRIFSIPPELIEETLVITAARGFPAAIAAFGRTCRHFHRLVYRSVDHHLWREVFLTTFDDPRLVLRRIGSTTTVGPGYSDMDVLYDWAGEFMARMNAARLFRREFTKNTPQVVDLFSDPQESSFTLAEALETVNTVLETAAPFPLHHTEALTASPTFPPLITLHCSITYPPEYTSHNARWVEDVFRHGYPPSLVKKYILAGHRSSHQIKNIEETSHGCPEEAQLFHKLVLRKGYVPVATPRGSEVSWTTLQSTEAQSVAAREVARSRVYNLRYLRPERSWGPFLPASGSMCDADAKPKPPSVFPDFESELSRYMLSNYIVDDVSDSEDEDFVPIEDEDEDNEEADDGVPHVVSFPFGRRRFDTKFVIPQPHEVVPDYIYLSGARILVEMNLREVLVADDPELGESGRSIHKILDALACLDFGRMGGTPAFWENSWVDTRAGEGVEEFVPPVMRHKGKGKATDIEWIEGWDWAGVAGHWVRVVCWLDYRDLLLHNLHGHNGDDMGETIHFFPMDLQISGYSRPPEPDFSEDEDLEALVWKLPVIHVEGESRGPATDVDPQYIRKVKGTVRMLKDGAIRWSLTTSYHNEDAPEWATEGIQIGSIGSAVGMLGMWTGADQ
ncbi:hypothetical protein DXG01_001739 [Tephrocybe rancida]|nr:hypothetical protein DXG01_001739 [Tephrocybe rancida]